jgi:hypothetical protein
VTVKLILEFTEEEREAFEVAYRGWQYRAALTDVREFLRQKLKYAELNPAQTDAYEAVQRMLFEATEGLDL